MKKILIALLFAAGIVGCNSTDTEKKADTSTSNDSMGTDDSENIDISAEAMEDIIRAVPSPIEISSLIKESGAKYNKDILNNVESAKNYSTSFKKAINLGIYGADLGYVNIYNEAQAIVLYLSAVKQLAEDLKVGQFFDFETIKRLSENTSNMDSILYITTSDFDKMDVYLREKKRRNISVAILSGGWVEAVYLSTQITKSFKSDLLKERIGEQKITLNEIILLLTVFKDDPNFTSFMNDLVDLKQIFDKVEITYTYEEPVTKEVNGVLEIQDKSSSKVIISPEQLAAITDKIAELRNKLIN